MRTVKKVAFIYLSQDSGGYYVTDDPGYSVQRRPQLGLQYLSAVLEKAGINTEIVDQTVFAFDIEWLIKKLAEYDIAGFYCSDAQEDKVKAYCKKIKEKLDIPILVGGPSTLNNSSFLYVGCDMVVHGEGEITIQQIVEYYKGKRHIEDIKGISYKKDGRVVKTPSQKLITNLDELPFPDRSKIDINSYYDYFLFGVRKPYITMIGSRGCMYRCSFCTSCTMWNYRYRVRSVDNVIGEIDDTIAKYGVRYIAFQDDVFGIDNNWLKEFCVKLIKKPYRVRWMAIFHPFSAKRHTEGMLKLMRRAGCDTLSFGLQSAHPDVLKKINRNPSEPEYLKSILSMANRLGFLTAVGYIFGLPGDTEKTIQDTIGYSLNCGSTLANYYVLSVLRFSEIETVYSQKKICDLDKERIQKLTIYASRKFYTRPSAIFRIAYFIVKNPGWIIKMGSRIPSILGRIGFERQ